MKKTDKLATDFLKAVINGKDKNKFAYFTDDNMTYIIVGGTFAYMVPANYFNRSYLELKSVQSCPMDSILAADKTTKFLDPCRYEMVTDTIKGKPVQVIKVETPNGFAYFNYQEIGKYLDFSEIDFILCNSPVSGALFSDRDEMVHYLLPYRKKGTENG